MQHLPCIIHVFNLVFNRAVETSFAYCFMKFPSKFQTRGSHPICLPGRRSAASTRCPLALSIGAAFWRCMLHIRCQTGPPCQWGPNGAACAIWRWMLKSFLAYRRWMCLFGAGCAFLALRPHSSLPPGGAGGTLGPAGRPAGLKACRPAGLPACQPAGLPACL